MFNFRSYVIAGLALAIASGTALADRCNVSIEIRERFNNPAGRGYAVANLGELLSQVERTYNIRTDNIEVLALSMDVRADTQLIMAWKDVSGRNQNSGAAIPVYGGRGTYRIDDAHWRNMVLSERGSVSPYDMDVNATGSGVVTAAHLTLKAPPRICDALTGRGGYDDQYDRRDDRFEPQFPQDGRGNGRVNPLPPVYENDRGRQMPLPREDRRSGRGGRRNGF